MMELALHAPSAHTLVECMRELKFGRPAQQQLIIDEAVNFIVARLGNDGPPFNPDILNEVFNKGKEIADASEEVQNPQQPYLAIVELFNRWLLTTCKSEIECNAVKSFCEYVQQFMK